MKPLYYTVVIAARNRLAAMRGSIPRMLSQSRPPAQLIVVDFSNDQPATVMTIKDSVGDHPADLVILSSERGGANAMPRLDSSSILLFSFPTTIPSGLLAPRNRNSRSTKLISTSKLPQFAPPSSQLRGLIGS